MTIPTNVKTGVNVFVSVVPLQMHPKYEYVVADEQDLTMELNSLKDAVHKFGAGANRVTEIKEHAHGTLLKGTTREECAKLNNFNGLMYHLIITPLITSWTRLSDEEFTTKAIESINETIEAIGDSTAYGTIEQALQIRSDVMQAIRLSTPESNEPLTIPERTLAILLAIDAE